MNIFKQKEIQRFGQKIKCSLRSHYYSYCSVQTVSLSPRWTARLRSFWNNNVHHISQPIPYPAVQWFDTQKQLWSLSQTQTVHFETQNKLHPSVTISDKTMFQDMNQTRNKRLATLSSFCIQLCRLNQSLTYLFYGSVWFMRRVAGDGW